MNALVDFVENLARYFKARHVGELFLFSLSVLLLTWTVAITLINSHDIIPLDRLDTSIRYFIQWFLAMTCHCFLTVLTLVVFVKKWGNVPVILMCLGFQGISIALLLMFLPLK